MLRRSILMGVQFVLIASVVWAQQPTGQGPGGAGQISFGGPFQGAPALLLAKPDVQKELRLDDDQKKQVEELIRDVEQQLQAALPNLQELTNLTLDDRTKRFIEARVKAEETSKTADKKLSKILDTKQLERFSQLRLQREGVVAFFRPEMEKQLGITREQGQKIREIFDSNNRLPGPVASEQEWRELVARQHARLQADVLAILTEEQRAKWEKMKGTEFKF